MATQTANDMDDVVAQAKNGNKVAYSIEPLTGAILISNGAGQIKRINSNEIQAVKDSGSLFDNLKAAIWNHTSGASIPANILDAQNKLTSAIRNNAYKTYSTTFDDTTKRYPLPNEVKKAAPGGGAPSYLTTATDPKTGHKVGTNDGWVTTYDLTTGKKI